MFLILIKDNCAYHTHYILHIPHSLHIHIPHKHTIHIVIANTRVDALIQVNKYTIPDVTVIESLVS